MVRLQRYVFILCMALSMMMAVPAGAQSTVSLTSSSGHPGDEVEVSVMLSNAQSATALQINIPHSPNLSYVDGSAVLNTQRVSGSHSLSASDKDNLLNLYVYDLSLNTFKEGTGAFITFRLKLGKEPGSYDLKPEAVLSDKASKPLPVSAQGGVVKILGPKISLDPTVVDFGSVPIRSTYTKKVSVGNTGNETLNVSEIKSGSALFKVSPVSMSIAAGQQSTLTIEYSPQNDGSDLADITLVSDATNGNQTVHVTASPFSENILSVANASGQAGETVTVSVSMRNMEPIVAAQCCFTLPEALKYVDGSAALSGRTSNGSHRISGTIEGDRLSFFIHSESNTALTGSEGELFTFKLLLDGTGGDYPLNPENVLLGNAKGRDMTSEVNGAVIRIAAPKMECASELTFGRVPMAETVKKVFAVRNSGESPLTIQRIEFSDDAFGLADATLPTIAAGKTHNLEVCYRPSGEEEFSGVMQIYCNDPQNRMQAVLISGTTYAPNQIELSGSAVSGQSGQYALKVSLQNTLPIVGMQFDLHWMTEMVPAPEVLSLSTRTAGHQVEVIKQEEGCYRVYLYSLDNVPIAPGSGPVLTLIYINKVEGQGYNDKTTILADQIILSTAEERNCASSPSAICYVGDLTGILGDANNDGKVDYADVTCITNYLLKMDVPGFVEYQADINQDKIINITDVVEIIHAIKKQ